jgi:hypothetical protein
VKCCIKHRHSLQDFAHLSESTVQDFTKTTSSIFSSISELRRRQEDFHPGVFEAVRRSEEEQKADIIKAKCQARARRERLEEFKMVKKIEPELPPLNRDDIPKEAPKIMGALDIVMRNTSTGAIDVWLPKKRYERMLNWKEVHEERIRSAIQQSEALVENRVLKIQKTALERNQDAVQFGHEQRKDCAQRWLAMIAVTGFLRRAREEVSLRRMEMPEVLAYVEKHQDRLTGYAKESHIVSHAVQVNTALKDRNLKVLLRNFVRIMRIRKVIDEKRSHARTIYTSLMGWRRGGRMMIAFFGFRQAVVLIQLWWRECRKKLHEQRDHVIKRWLAIEKSELIAEERKRHEAIEESKSAKQRPGHHLGIPETMLGHNKKHSMSAAARRRFIENELRTLRYLLLPKIDIWQKDVIAWRKDFKEWEDESDAYYAMGKPVALKLFRWPPVRPSFMPPAHFRDHCDQTHGRPCPETCPGRRGDAMILDMWRRAREDPENYTRIPEKRGSENEKASFRSTRRKALCGDAVAYASSIADAGIFGPPPSTADQEKLGILSDMPGVHGGHGSAALHEGEAKAWISQMAAASTSMVGVNAGIVVPS